MGAFKKVKGKFLSFKKLNIFLNLKIIINLIKKFFD